MRWDRPKSPSDRDFEIYYAVMAHDRKQMDVAAKYKISQPRVSQILRRVERFLAEYAPLRERTPRQRMYLALDCYNEALAGYSATAKQSFEDQHGWNRKAEESNTPGRRPPRADARLLGIGIQAIKLQIENQEKLVKAEEELKEELLESEDTREDIEVEDLVDSCKYVKRDARRFEKAGLQPPPVPELDEVALEINIRNSLRKERKCEHTEHLPGDWRETFTNFYDKPLRKFGEPEPEPVANESFSKNDAIAPNAFESNELNPDLSTYKAGDEWQEVADELARESDENAPVVVDPPPPPPKPKRPIGLRHCLIPDPINPPPRRERNPNNIRWQSMLGP